MATHQAYVLDSFDKPLSLKTVPTRRPASGQILVQVLSAPILSYSALVLSGGIGFPMTMPLTPGPSAIARVISVGEDATNIAESQLVFCAPIVRARDDSSGLTSILHGWNGGASSQSLNLMTNSWRDGSWAEKMILPLENAVPLDEQKLTRSLGYFLPQLIWINELLVAYGPLEASGLTVGDVVIVAPATGHFGGSAVRLAVALGAGTVIAAARSKDKLQALKELDSKGRVKSMAFSGDAEADTKALIDMTPHGRGADIYVDFSPFQASNATHPLICISALKSGGMAILNGGVRTDLPLNYAQMMFKNLTVRGNFMYSANAPRKLISLIESGVVSLDGFNVTAFDFNRLQEGIDSAPKHESFSNLAAVLPTQ